MQLQQVFYWSRKIHTLLMWLAILFGVPLAITGVLLHQIVEGESSFFLLDPYMVRWLHSKVSNPFALVLAGMMITGFLMWIIPKILSKRAKNKLS